MRAQDYGFTVLEKRMGLPLSLDCVFYTKNNILGNAAINICLTYDTVVHLDFGFAQTLTQTAC